MQLRLFPPVVGGSRWKFSMALVPWLSGSMPNKQTKTISTALVITCGWWAHMDILNKHTFKATTAHLPTCGWWVSLEVLYGLGSLVERHAAADGAEAKAGSGQRLLEPLQRAVVLREHQRLMGSKNRKIHKQEWWNAHDMVEPFQRAVSYCVNTSA
jgi:hypothetical protein